MIEPGEPVVRAVPDKLCFESEASPPTQTTKVDGSLRSHHDTILQIVEAKRMPGDAMAPMMQYVEEMVAFVFDHAEQTRRSASG